MATVPADIDAGLEQQRLLPLYLKAHRQRFKAEVNRLTGGEMAARLGGPEAADLAFLMTYVQAWHWLRQHVHADYRWAVLEAFSRGRQGFLMRLLHESETAEDFVRGYVAHWQAAPAEAPVQRDQCLRLLARRGGDVERLVADVLARWRAIDPWRQPLRLAYRDLAREEKERYANMLGPEDRERLALVDALPDPTPGRPFRFDKAGIIPAMGCPQTCRHCMFIFRPLMRDLPDPQGLLDQVNGLTDSVLFTGGDLTRQLDHFYRAIETMDRIGTFAILLNGDFADDRAVTREVLERMAAALRRRRPGARRAHVLLQISFDELHQEVMVDKKGRLRERIPVRKIANIVELAPRYRDRIQLCLVHKQHALNFSLALFEQGVFARLFEELGRRGHRIEVRSAAPSPRRKRNPLAPDAPPAPVIKDASFVLADHPDVPILVTSSTIDAYGRARLLDPCEAVNERDLLRDVLAGRGAGGEFFDTDLMFWFNGWATLFAAVHIALGNVYEDGLETVLARQRKDPLARALHDFDLRLLDFYRERADDLDALIAQATGPHHLFHTITESPAMRLHMTRRLIETAA